MLLTLKDALLAFGHRALLDHAELQIDNGERIALIGRNGTGKSSLLNILAGTAALDKGELWVAQSARVTLVPQEPVFEAGQIVYAAVAEGVGAASRTLAAYHVVADALAHGSASADLSALTDELSRLQALIERDGAWALDHRIEAALSALELDGNRHVDELSGGWKKRVALARAMVADPAVLLLDEPTNHLDIEGIAWLENVLREFSGAVVCITHDRRFIDAIATRVVELDRGTLRSYPGGFDRYREQKQQQLEVESTMLAKADKYLAGEEVWIRKGVEARRTRNAGRVLRLERLRALRAERKARMGRVSLQVDRGDASGKLVAELENATVRFGERTVIDRFTTRLMRGDKIGLIGPNGCGKTTLLRLILGELEPDPGTVKRGTNLQVAYYDQMREVLDPEATLADTISPGSDMIEIGKTKKHIISYLEDFLFDPVRARSPVKTLSGGERNRLLLARLFARPANVLVLDEPTNDLDIDTLELLEEMLQDYTGTLFLVSHDRAFLDNVVTQVIAFEGDGVLREYPGGYSDWVSARERMQAIDDAQRQETQRTEKQRAGTAQGGKLRDARSGVRTDAPSGSNAAKAATPPSTSIDAKDGAPSSDPASGNSGKTDGRTSAAKLSFREKQELGQLPARIDALETRIVEIQQQLADPALYQRDPEQARSGAHELKSVEDELTAAYTKWEMLEARC